MSISNAQPTILYLAHSYHNRAGVEEHIRVLQHELKDRYKISVVFPHSGNIHYIDPGGSEKILPGDPPHWPVTPKVLERSSKVFGDLLREISPDLIHIQHIFNWPLSVLEQAISFGVPTLMSHHDYYLITPYFTMEGVRDPSECFTPQYSKKAFGQDISKYLSERREYLASLLPKVTTHISPSPFLGSVLSRIYPLPFKIIEHGITPFIPLPKTPSSSLRFGCVGSLIPQKGWESLVRAFANWNPSPEVATLHFYGGTHPLKHPGIFFHGVYEQKDLPRITQEIDVAVIPSVFPETFSLVLSEMWQGKLPVAASNIGALGERIDDKVNGKLFIPGNLASIRETLEWFTKHTEWKNWGIPIPKTSTEMGDEYAALYGELLG